MRTPSEAIADLLSRPPAPAIAAAAANHDGAVLLVGGALRDALLDRPPADLDIAVGGDFEAFLEAFTRACGRRPVPIGDLWRDTRRTRCDDIQVDVARLLGGVEADLGRRDFTINAMAVVLSSGGAGSVSESCRPDPDDGLIDPHDGRGDLAGGIIRMLSEAALEDDPLRLLRAPRYAATLQGFRLDEHTTAAIRDRAGSIGGVASERVQTEWAHLLRGRDWARAAGLAFDAGLGATVVQNPELFGVAAWEAFEAASATPAYDDDSLTARLAALVVGDARVDPDGAHRRLVERRWPAALSRKAVRAAHWAQGLDPASSSDLVDWVLEDRGAVRLAACLAAALADQSGAPRSLRIQLLEDYSRRAAESPWVRGADLRSWGMPEGRELGTLLTQVAKGQVQRRWSSAGTARSWARRQATHEASGTRQGADG